MKLLILLLCGLLAACSETSREIKFLAMPPELADCKVFRVENSGGYTMTVARCPHSTTTTEVQQGKITLVAVVAEG